MSDSPYPGLDAYSSFYSKSELRWWIVAHRDNRTAERYVTCEQAVRYPGSGTDLIHRCLLEMELELAPITWLLPAEVAWRP